MPDQYREPIEEEKTLGAQAPNPAAGSVEQEILELEKKLAAKRGEQQKSVEQAINLERTAPPAQTAPVPPQPVFSAPNPADVKADAERVKGIEKNQQIKNLVDLAFVKGAAHATEVVRNLDNPYLIDEFHDTLVDQMRQKLIEAGKLEEI